jgi:hypothetical protein
MSHHKVRFARILVDAGANQNQTNGFVVWFRQDCAVEDEVVFLMVSYFVKITKETKTTSSSTAQSCLNQTTNPFVWFSILWIITPNAWREIACFFVTDGLVGPGIYQDAGETDLMVGHGKGERRNPFVWFSILWIITPNAWRSDRQKD